MRLKLQEGSIVEVRFVVREGAIVRDKWRGAIVTMIPEDEKSFYVRMLDNEHEILVLPMDKGNNEKWR